MLNNLKERLFFHALINNITKRRKEEDIVFKVAQSQEEKEGAYRLRYKVFCKEWGYLPLSKYPSGQEYDEYDTISSTIIAIKPNTNQVIGTIRVIKETSGRPLPLERYSPISTYGDQLTVFGELSRLTVDKKYRSKYDVAFGLIKSSILFSRKIGITDFCISVAVDRAERYSRFGFSKVGEQYQYQDIAYPRKSITLIANIEDNLKKMKHQYPEFYKFFSS